MCPLFRISETAGRIALKFGVSLENRQPGILPKSRVGAQLHVCTRAPLFRISETAGQIALKFGMLLEAHDNCLQRSPLAKRFKEVNGGIHVHVRPHPFRIWETAGRVALKIGVW